MAQSMPGWLIPTPWSIGITAIQWMNKDKEKVLYVELTAEGNDLDDARRNAFRMAVERSIGAVISAESQATNGKLVQDDIITYASGYVKDYQLVETKNLGDRVQVKMNVWVSSNKLANRLLNQSRAAGSVEGPKISQQIESLQYERANGDRLLLSVLNDYPYRAFDVRVSNTRVTMDSTRSPILHIPVEVNWNDRYLDSIGTAVKSINQQNGCDRWFKPIHCDRVSVHIRAGNGQAWMDDDIAWNLFLREMITTKPQIMLTMLDSSGNWIFKQCVGFGELDHQSYSPHHYVEVDAGRVLINDGMKRRFEIALPIGSYPIMQSQLDRIEARIVRNKDCKA